jgi:hypothetical protein
MMKEGRIRKKNIDDKKRDRKRGKRKRDKEDSNPQTQKGQRVKPVAPTRQQAYEGLG